MYRYISLGLLVSTVPPFVEILVRYFLALAQEFHGDYEGLRSLLDRFK